jgi:hypothetical protein
LQKQEQEQIIIKQQQKKNKKILAEGEEAINACEKQEEVDKIVEETPEKFKDIKPRAPVAFFYLFQPMLLPAAFVKADDFHYSTSSPVQ